MKQKNMILVAVAVACGLVAAVLTSQISAGNKVKSEETVPVLVAAKDLPVGSWLKKDAIHEYVEVRDVPAASAPQVFVGNIDDLADKRVVRTMRKGDSFNPKDVSKSAAIAPPDGYGMMSIPCTLDETVTGFVQPGSKVNILASIPSKRMGDRATVVTFLHDMLVLAVDGSSTIQTENPVAATVGTVSFAVTSATAELLHAAKSRGCNMRLVLVGQTPMLSPEPPLTHKQLWALLADVPVQDDNGSDTPAKAKKEDAVKLVVAREDIAAGTQLTQEVIDAMFEMKEFAKPAPANGIENVRESAGKFVTKDLAAGQFLPKSFVGADPKAAPKVGPTDGSTSKEAGEEPVKKAPELPPVFHDVTITTANGTKKIRYQVLPNGDYKFLGEIAVNAAPDRIPAPDDADAKGEKKPEPKAAPKAAPKSGEPAKEGDRV
jgi:Flp pilus assembly protein CpaB